MKYILFLSIFCSQVVMAEVAKPVATTAPSKAETTIDNQLFIYTITDRGWFTAGSIYPGYDVKSEKYYMLDYESSQSNATTEALIRADAANKCDELGQMDFNELQRISGVDYTLQSSLDTTSFYFYSTPTTLAGYNCYVQIRALKN